MSWICKVCSGINEDDNDYECFICGAPDFDVKYRIEKGLQYRKIKIIYDFLMDYVFKTVVIFFCVVLAADIIATAIIRPFSRFSFNVNYLVSCLRNRLLSAKACFTDFPSLESPKVLADNLQKISISKDSVAVVCGRLFEKIKLHVSVLAGNANSIWFILMGSIHLIFANIKRLSAGLPERITMLKNNVVGFISHCREKIEGWD